METNEKFHDTAKGCVLRMVIEPSEIRMHGDWTLQYCETHQVRVCNCGWEFGYHYGQYSGSKKIKEKNERYAVGVTSNAT